MNLNCVATIQLKRMKSGIVDSDVFMSVPHLSFCRTIHLLLLLFTLCSLQVALESTDESYFGVPVANGRCILYTL